MTLYNNAGYTQPNSQLYDYFINQKLFSSFPGLVEIDYHQRTLCQHIAGLSPELAAIVNHNDDIAVYRLKGYDYSTKETFCIIQAGPDTEINLDFYNASPNEQQAFVNSLKSYKDIFYSLQTLYKQYFNYEQNLSQRVATFSSYLREYLEEYLKLITSSYNSPEYAYLTEPLTQDLTRFVHRIFYHCRITALREDMYTPAHPVYFNMLQTITDYANILPQGETLLHVLLKTINSPEHPLYLTITEKLEILTYSLPQTQIQDPMKHPHKVLSFR